MDKFVYTLARLSIIERVKEFTDEWDALGKAVRIHIKREEKGMYSEETSRKSIVYKFLHILEKYSIKEEVWVFSEEWPTVVDAINQYSKRDKLYESRE